MDNRVFLKVKLKSLAEESRIIRHEERKRKLPREHREIPANLPLLGDAGKDPVKRAALKLLGKDEKSEIKARRERRRGRDWYPKSLAELHQLQLHRRAVVSHEARLTHIAYAFIRGRSLATTDKCGDLDVDDWKRVIAMVKKYDDEKGFDDWLLASYPDRFMRLSAIDASLVMIAA